jgi:hypothetical protein
MHWRVRWLDLEAFQVLQVAHSKTKSGCQKSHGGTDSKRSVVKIRLLFTEVRGQFAPTMVDQRGFSHLVARLSPVWMLSISPIV